MNKAVALAPPAELIGELASLLQSYLQAHTRSAPLLVGLHRGGVWVANALHDILGLQDPCASLDVSFYRDDFQTAGLQGEARGSDLPIDINGRVVVLVDDVLFTGRTIRAAMNALFDFGRPASITLAVLVQRSGRELPIQPDCCAVQLLLPKDEIIKLQSDSSGGLSWLHKPREMGL